MNVATHQKKNEKTKTGKRKAGVEKRQATDLKEAACCPSAVVQGAALRKHKMFERSALGKWAPQKGQQPFRPIPNGAGDRTTTID